MVFRFIAAAFVIASFVASVSVRADEPLHKMRAEDLLAREAAIDVLQSQTSTDQAKLNACRTLARIGPDAERADFLLIKLLQSPDLSSAAANTLRAIGPRASPEMASEMRWVNAELAQAVSDVLISMGKDAAGAVPTLREMLASRDTDQRMLAMMTLKGLGPVASGAAPDLERLIAAEGLGERAMARLALHSVTRDAPPQEQDRINKLIGNIDALRNKFTSIPQGIEAAKALPGLAPDVQLAANTLLETARINDPVRDVAIGPPIVPQMIEHIRQNDIDAPTAELVLAKMGPQAAADLPNLVHIFRESNPLAAASACRVLAGLGPFAASTSDDLRLAMMNPDGDVRAEALRALLSVMREANPIVRAQIEEDCRPIEMLRSGNSNERVAACRALQKLGSRAELAAYDLAEALQDDATSQAAADALRAIGPTAAGAIAYAIGGDKHGDARAVALLPTLDEKTREFTVSPLRYYLKHSWYSAVIRSCRALAALGPAASASLDDLHELVTNRFEDVRAAAIDAIVAIDPKGEGKLLHGIATLYDEDLQARQRAVAWLEREALERVPRGEVIIELAPLLLHGDPRVRQSAQEMLLRVKGPDTRLAARLQRIEPRINGDPNPQIAATAKLTMLIVELRLDPAGQADRSEVLQMLLDPNSGDALADGIAGSGPSAAPLFAVLARELPFAPQARPRFLRAMAGIAGGVTDPQEAANVFSPALSDSDPANRASAVAGLAQLGDAARPTLPQIVNLLRSRQPSDVVSAAKAIAHLSPQAANEIPAIIQSLRSRLEAAPAFDDDSAMELRAACADALATVAPDSQDARDMLLLAVKRKDWAVRERLAPAIAKANQKPPALVDTLEALADGSPEELVRINARCALRELGEHAPGDVP